MNTMRSIEQVELAAEMLSIADLLNGEWKVRVKSYILM